MDQTFAKTDEVRDRVIAIVLPPENADHGIRAADEWAAVSRNPNVVPTADQNRNAEHAAECSGPPSDGCSLAGQLMGKSQDDKRDDQNSGRLC